MISTRSEGGFSEIGRIPAVRPWVTILQSESDGWRDLGFVVKSDPETHYHGVIEFDGQVYQKRETDRRLDWRAPLPGQMLFARTSWLDEAGPEIRRILAEQGFSAPLNGREQIFDAGVIERGANAYHIYTYRGVHQPVPGGVDHGVNKIIVFLNESEFLGQYSVPMPAGCRVSDTLIECATGTPPSVIEFGPDGPPDEIWFDGEVLPFERANSVRS